MISALGILLEEEEGKLVVQAIYPGGPASIACDISREKYGEGWGIQAGDVLLRVDDVEVLGRDPVQVRSLLRGAPDTKVVLRFLRKEMGETRDGKGFFDIEIQRRSSVKDKSMIFQGTPERHPMISLQQSHQDSAMHDRELKTPKIFEELMPSDSVTPCRSDMKPPRLHENSLGFQAASLKQKVAELEQELREAKSQAYLSSKIVDRLHFLEDKLFETETNMPIMIEQRCDAKWGHVRLELLAEVEEKKKEANVFMNLLKESEDVDSSFTLPSSSPPSQNLAKANEKLKAYRESEEMLRQQLLETKRDLKSYKEREQQQQQAQVDPRRAELSNSDHPVDGVLYSSDREERRVQYYSSSMNGWGDSKMTEGLKHNSLISGQLLKLLEENEELRDYSTRLELQLAGQEKSRRSQRTSPNSTEHLHEIAMRQGVHLLRLMLNSEEKSRVSKSLNEFPAWLVAAIFYYVDDGEEEERVEDLRRWMEESESNQSPQQIQTLLLRIAMFFSFRQEELAHSLTFKDVARGVRLSLKLTISFSQNVDVVRLAVLCVCAICVSRPAKHLIHNSGMSDVIKLSSLLSHDDELVLLFATEALCHINVMKSVDQLPSTSCLSDCCSLLKHHNGDIRRNCLLLLCQFSLKPHLQHVLKEERGLAKTLKSLAQSEDPLERKRAECALDNITKQ
ncbi:hypothetical protein GUITHDRAFT_107795 [Guillardia theta CCMP2712]|uniref:PDZ domain-containing protein n=1 Tax=Guillardia theta (strain CCMP2712) TaxID=905079 RepID=L1JCA5_GUITC|nr:hypothetical protein GUITHDRAFT_107795 [Guillardia theta CCMP2712]EKX46178.1 hypothetical protein GUITHDRAFT_107795 [Guillardia theta CCMP2712]|eukprot:XP_005833158.1 hypothetical protein GUITHDRAFT_107795 [Guillardia theta CCMP2712]